MGTTLTGKRVQNTYDSLLKIGDNDNLTGTAKRIGDGLGNDSPIFLSTTKIGIGVTPTYEFQTNSHAKIGGNLIVGGNLTVNGTTTIIDSTVIAIGDNMMEMAKDNVSNTMDIGWYGTINSSGEKYVGVFYDASSGVATPEFHIGLGTSEPSSTASWTTKGKLVIGALDATTGVFSGQVTIPATPVSSTDAASKGYVDAQITAQDLDIAGDSGTGAVDLDSQTFTISGGTNVTTSVSGQTVTINASGGIDGSGTANDVVMWQDSDTLTDAPIAISGNNATFAGNISVADSVTVTGSGYGSLELGGPSGGYIDLKAPASDDYDIRIITSSGGNEITTASGDLKINTGNTLALTLNGSNQNATFASNVSLVASSAVNLRVTDGTQNIYVGSSGSTRFGLSSGASIIQSTGASFGIGTQDGNNFILGANNTAVLTLDTSANATFNGNVTITSSGSGTFSIINTNASQTWGQYVGSNDDYVFRDFTDSRSTLVLHGDGNATFAGSITATGNITTDGIFINENAPDDEVIQFIQSGRKTSLKTYFASSGTGSYLDFNISDSTTSGGTNHMLRIYATDAVFYGDVILGNTVSNPATGFADQSGIGLQYSGTVPKIEVSSDAEALSLNRTTTGGDGVIADFRYESNSKVNIKTNKVEMFSPTMGTYTKLGVAFDIAGSAANLSESVNYSTVALSPLRSGSSYGMYFGNANTSVGYIQLSNTAGNATGSLNLQPYGGSVGIGQGFSAPGSTLHVVGSFRTDLDSTYHQGILNEYVSTFVSRTKFGRVGTTSNLEIYYDIAGTEEARITRNYTSATLKFMRGTTTDLEINGSGNATFGGTAAFASNISAPVVQANVINNQANSANIIYRSGTQTIVGGGSSTQKVKIEDNGTTYVQGEIHNEMAAPKIRLKPTTQNNASIIELGVLNGGTNAYARIDAINLHNYDSNLRFWTNEIGSTTQVERMRITSSGQVKITSTGSTNNDDTAIKFDINSTNHIKQRITTSSTGGYQASLELESQGNAVSIATAGSNEIRFNTSGSEKMRIDSSGQVGIGSSPSTKLHISGGDSAIRITPTGGNDPRIDFTDNGGTVRFYTGYDVSSGNFVITSDEGGFGSSNIMVMSDAGNVIIGNSSVDNPNSLSKVLEIENGGSVGVILNDSRDNPIGLENRGAVFHLTHNTNSRLVVDGATGDATFAGKISSVKELINVNSANGTRSGGFEVQDDGDLFIGTATTAGNIVLETGNTTNGLPSTGTARLTINSTSATFAGDIFGNDRLYLAGIMALDVNGTDLYVGATTSANHNDQILMRTNDANRFIIKSDGAFEFTNQFWNWTALGSGTFTQAALYYDSSNGFLLENSWTTNSTSGSRRPLVFTWRGGFGYGGIKLTGNTQLFTDNTGLGINRTNPSYLLDAYGQARITDSSNNGILYLGETANTRAARVYGRRSPSYSSTGKLQFDVTTWGAGSDYGPTELMNIEIVGPDTKKGFVRMMPHDGYLQLGGGSAYTGTGVSSITINDDNYPLLALGSTSANRSSLISYSTYNLFTSANNIVFDSRFVGIREYSPNAYLHVTGKTSYTTANSSEVSGLEFIRLQPNSNSEHSLWIHNASNNLGISGYSDAATSSTRDITLQTYGGRVGIGVATPDFELEVAGSIGIDDYIYHNGDHNTYIRAMGDAWVFRTGGSDRMKILNTGVQVGPNGADSISLNDGPLRVSNNSTGNSAMVRASNAIQLGPSTTRSAVSGYYYGGITWNGLMNYTNGTGYDIAPHVWLGSKYHDFPGSERSKFCIGVKSGTGTSGSGNDVPVERLTIDYSGTLTMTGDIVAFSDGRLKDNVKTIDNALDKVNKLRGVSYVRNDIEDDAEKIGVIAQEVIEVLPQVVKHDIDEDKYSVAYGNMAGVFIEAIKELTAKVEELENKCCNCK